VRYVELVRAFPHVDRLLRRLEFFEVEAGVDKKRMDAGLALI
jgi:hypothetical protein